LTQFLHLLLVVTISALIAGGWVVFRRHQWAMPGLVAATLMWFFAVLGGHLWNLSRKYNGSGIPPSMAADTVLGSPAMRALLWASAGSLLGVAAFMYLQSRRSKSVTWAQGPTVVIPTQRLRVDVLRPTSLIVLSAALFVAWLLGQGPSIWARDTYLAADGIGALLTATTVPAPLIGATALAISLILPASRETRALSVALGVVWWICTLAVGTRLAIAFPLAVAAALVAKRLRVRRSRLRLFGDLALAYLTLYLIIFSFSVTLEVRHIPHGLSYLPELFASDTRPGPFALLSWGPMILLMVSSVTSGFVITDYSVLHPPPAKILWLNANPLPGSIAGIDAFSYERMWPLDWVPLSMAGEWYGIYGAVGQLLLYGVTAFAGAWAVDYFNSRKQRFFAALVMVLTIANVTISVQYPSRWFWRLLSLVVLLPVAYIAGMWMLNRIKPYVAQLTRRTR
jgi:iron complex transport system permease protein